MGLFFRKVTISSGIALSDGVLTGEGKLVGIYFPAAWDAANLTFQTGPEVQGSLGVADVTWHDVYKQDGNELVITEPTGGFDGRYVELDDVPGLDGAEWIRVRSGTGTTPVNQTADRVLTLALRC